MFEAGSNLTFELARKIGSAIVNGEYSKTIGFTSMTEIASKHKLSLNIVREAIKILYAKGLLSISQRSGITISPPEQWNLFDTDVLGWALNSNSALEFFSELSELRRAIEPEAARLAALQYNDRRKINTIYNALLRIKEAAIGSNALLEAESDFHTAILLASNNPYFMEMHKYIKISTTMRFSFQNQSNITVEPNHRDYEIIFEAIATGNAAHAFQASSHLAKKIADLAKIVTSSYEKPQPLTH